MQIGSAIQTRFVGPVSMFDRIRKQVEAVVDGVCKDDAGEVALIASIC